MEDVTVERLIEYSDEDAEGIGHLMPFLSDTFTGEPVAKDLLEAIILSPHHDQLIARLEGRIVGAATMSIIIGTGAGRIGYLEDFVTDPEVRKRGIGTKVWEEMKTWCKEQGVNLEFTSRPSRTDAHHFYLAKGAVVRDTTVFHVDVEKNTF